ncbi:MAG: hypothetical protein ABI323_09965 [Solirubrobacteraceae bacterium]
MSSEHHGPVLVVDDHPVNRRLLEHVLELEEIDTLGKPIDTRRFADLVSSLVG